MRYIYILIFALLFFPGKLFSEQKVNEFRWEKYKDKASYEDIYKCLYDYKLGDTPKIDYSFKDNLGLLVLQEKTILHCKYKKKDVDSVVCSYKPNLTDPPINYYIKNSSKLLSQTTENVEGYELNTPYTEKTTFNFMVKRIKESSENYKNVNIYSEKCGFFDVYTKDCEKLFLKLPFATEDIVKTRKKNHEIDIRRQDRLFSSAVAKQRLERDEDNLKYLDETLFNDDKAFIFKRKVPLPFYYKKKKWSKLELSWLKSIERIQASKDEYYNNCSKFINIVNDFYGPIENQTTVPRYDKSTGSKQTGQSIK